MMRPTPRPATLAAMKVFIITAAAGLVLLVTACGTGSSPAAGGATGPATGSSGLLAYSSCVRAHGVPDFPDPVSGGGIPKETQQQLGVSDSQMQAAQSACEHLLPPGGSLSGQPVLTITAQQQQYYLRAVACMHSHGITSFPEPVFGDGTVEFPMLEHLVDLQSTQFAQANQICRKLIPPGLPDSGS
jgi:hypothetical protein